jgi:hypothetical protein
MSGWVTLDTIHLSVKYPKADAYRRWARVGDKLSHRERRAGVVEGDCVVKGGACGYKVSVWQKDARAYLTDQVGELVGDGGMGVWVQLGPKFLIANISRLGDGVAEFLRSVGVSGSWQTKITRLDLAVDVAGVRLDDIPLQRWRDDWVGWSRMSSMHFNSETGPLETVYIGKRGSPIFLRIYDKVVEAEKDGDLEWWRAVWEGFDGPVWRVEWETRLGDAGFVSIGDLDSYDQEELKALANYLVTWGRLCDRPVTDSNRARWPSSEFWCQVEDAVAQWSVGNRRVARREAPRFGGVNPKYVKFLSGVVSSGMARLGNREVNLVGLLDGLSEYGESLEVIQKKARAKADRLERL